MDSHPFCATVRTLCVYDTRIRTQCVDTHNNSRGPQIEVPCLTEIYVLEMVSVYVCVCVGVCVCVCVVCVYVCV